MTTCVRLCTSTSRVSSGVAAACACSVSYLSHHLSPQNFDEVKTLFMQSDGGLTPVQDFRGSRAILSGPAGGVVGYATTSFGEGGGGGGGGGTEDKGKDKPAVIGFDMGGTSTGACVRVCATTRKGDHVDERLDGISVCYQILCTIQKKNNFIHPEVKCIVQLSRARREMPHAPHTLYTRTYACPDCCVDLISRGGSSLELRARSCSTVVGGRRRWFIFSYEVFIFC